MENNSNHIIYNANDIIKYHEGKLSSSEMHAMEKAALDDPFLADALEGYADIKDNRNTELQSLLQKRIGTSKTKVIAFPWLRIAAIAIFIMGAGLLIYQFGFHKNHNEPIAMEKPSVKSDANGQSMAAPQISGSDSPTVESRLASNSKPGSYRTEEALKEKKSEDAAFELDSSAASQSIANVAQPAPLMMDRAKPSVANDSIQTIVVGYGTAKAQSENIFRGLVQNDKKQQLAFVNIENLNENDESYSDGEGRFELRSNDTLLRVMLRSRGYVPKMTQLRNGRSESVITLQPEVNELAEVVVVQKNMSAAQTKEGNPTNVIPKDGWDKYNLYLLNNMHLEAVTRNDNPGEVVLSFSVNKSGKPINISVLKSLCDACDKEAIRLLKEGPEWNRINSKAKGSLTVRF